MSVLPVNGESYLPSLDTPDMPNTIGEDTTEDASDNIPHEPRSVSQRLFRPLVPHCHDDGQPWADGRLSCAQKEPDSEQTFSVGASCSERKDSTPYEATSD
jgi:hypothetical protein